MHLSFRLLPLLLACTGSALADPDASARKPERAKSAGAEHRRHELRDAVEAHRSAKREEVQHDEAVAGRRLTAAERAELREQLRRHWAASAAAPHPEEPQPAERVVPTPVAEAAPSRNLLPIPRSERP